MLSEREKFVNNSIKRGYDKEVAVRVYDLILKFANYGFNKAHSISYAVTAYKNGILLKLIFLKYFYIRYAY